MDIVIRAAVVYLFVWLVLRALGKRELASSPRFELVLLFVIGDLGAAEHHRRATPRSPRRCSRSAPSHSSS